MSGKRSRDKGARFENKIAKDLSAALNEEFGRSIIQTRGGGAENGDICLKYPHRNPVLSGLHFELKHHKKASIPSAWRQAVEDCKTSGRTPVCITKSDNEPELATVSYDFFKKLLVAWLGNGDASDS